MLTCKLCKQRIRDGQVFAEVNMTKLLRSSMDELSMEYYHDENEGVLHRECFLAMLAGSPVPDVKVEAEEIPGVVKRTDPLEFFV